MYRLTRATAAGDITMYGSPDSETQTAVLRAELKYCKEMLAQKERENELLREMLAVLSVGRKEADIA